MVTHVHLVGSVGLDSAQDVFSTAGNLLGQHLLRAPDGEPGGRRMWVNWQYPLLRGVAYLQPDWEQKPNVTGCLPLKIVDGVKVDEIRFGELGYAREARASYQDFLAARTAGVLSPSARFQVCLPTPFAVLGSLVRREDAPAVEPAYESAMIREVETLCSVIPHEDLCIQWDICIEMIAFDGRSFIRAFLGMEQYFGERFARLCKSIPDEVELGFHLCYGDLDAKHTIDPEDAGKLRDMAHLISASILHPIAYIHMPVPVDRNDDAFFAPLADLRLGDGTELFLGLVHVKDGVDGTKRRMDAARKYVRDFGIASECGISRARTPELVSEYLRVHAAAAKASSV